MSDYPPNLFRHSDGAAVVAWTKYEMHVATMVDFRLFTPYLFREI